MTANERKALYLTILIFLFGLSVQALPPSEADGELRVFEKAQTSLPTCLKGSDSLCKNTEKATGKPTGKTAEKNTERSRSASSIKGAVLINQASLSELQTLRGIGPALARRILQYREKYGPFRSGKYLRRVKGIGPKKLKNILPYVEFD